MWARAKPWWGLGGPVPGNRVSCYEISKSCNDYRCQRLWRLCGPMVCVFGTNQTAACLLGVISVMSAQDHVAPSNADIGMYPNSVMG
jgi:hypothetical protein